MTLFVCIVAGGLALMVGGALIYRNNAAKADAAIRSVESAGKAVVDEARKV